MKIKVSSYVKKGIYLHDKRRSADFMALSNVPFQTRIENEHAEDHDLELVKYRVVKEESKGRNAYNVTVRVP